MRKSLWAALATALVLAPLAAHSVGFLGSSFGSGSPPGSGAGGAASPDPFSLHVNGDNSMNAAITSTVLGGAHFSETPLGAFDCLDGAVCGAKLYAPGSGQVLLDEGSGSSLSLTSSSSTLNGATSAVLQTTSSSLQLVDSTGISGTPLVNDGASAVAWVLNTTLLSNATAKIASFQNNNVEKANVDLNGVVTTVTGYATSVAPAAGPLSVSAITPTMILCDTSGGDVSITLPAIGAVHTGIIYRIKKTSNLNNCRVFTTGADTIDGHYNSGAAPIVMSSAGSSQGQSGLGAVEILSNGTNWFLLNWYGPG